jgi:hypothetical protein
MLDAVSSAKTGVEADKIPPVITATAAISVSVRPESY